jgi:hypothetical protein
MLNAFHANRLQQVYGKVGQEQKLGEPVEINGRSECGTQISRCQQVESSVDCCSSKSAGYVMTPMRTSTMPITSSARRIGLSSFTTNIQKLAARPPATGETTDLH